MDSLRNVQHNESSRPQKHRGLTRASDLEPFQNKKGSKVTPLDLCLGHSVYQVYKFCSISPPSALSHSLFPPLPLTLSLRLGFGFLDIALEADVLQVVPVLVAVDAVVVRQLKGEAFLLRAVPDHRFRPRACAVRFACSCGYKSISCILCMLIHIPATRHFRPA